MNQIYNPKVSIIIIGYNIESYLDKCLESVFHQTYTNYEAIFVNDGSQDGTIHVAKKYSEKYGLHIIDKQNGGIVSARKAGLAYATGEYVAFVDGDDWLNNHMVTSLVDALDKGMRDADIVCSNFKLFMKNLISCLQINSSIFHFSRISRACSIHSDTFSKKRDFLILHFFFLSHTFHFIIFFPSLL